MCFFFKQKRSYEMRISDWSSDVCSSYLLISTRTFPVISCMAFCAAALSGKSPPSRGENNRGALSAIGKRLPIIDGDLHKVHAMPMLKGGLAAKQMDAIVTHVVMSGA